MKFSTKIALLLAIFMSFSQKIVAKEAKDYTFNDNTWCYAQVAFHEARGQGRTAMKLVQSVTYNRVKAQRWPRSACAVVYQSGQYAWTRLPIGHRVSSSTRLAPSDAQALAEALSLARSLRAGHWHPSISADHFLSPEALPRRRNGTLRFPAWARCQGPETACVVYRGYKVRAPDFTYNGFWFYTLRGNQE